MSCECILQPYDPDLLIDNNTAGNIQTNYVLSIALHSQVKKLFCVWAWYGFISGEKKFYEPWTIYCTGSFTI